MPFVYYVSELEKDVPLDAERLLRLLGVSGKLSGFYFAVYMLERVQEKPEYVLLITKRLYRQSAALQYNDQLCGEKSAHACASLLETAGSQYAGSNRGMPIITAANQHAIPRYAGILSP